MAFALVKPGYIGREQLIDGLNRFPQLPAGGAGHQDFNHEPDVK
jgi:hypothetical protein